MNLISMKIGVSNKFGCSVRLLFFKCKSVFMLREKQDEGDVYIIVRFPLYPVYARRSFNLCSYYSCFLSSRL